MRPIRGTSSRRIERRWRYAIAVSIVVAIDGHVRHNFHAYNIRSRCDQWLWWNVGLGGCVVMVNKIGLAVACVVGAAACATALIAVSTRSVAVTAATAGSVVYHYDSLGRIVQDSYPANAASYTYDNAGNRTQATIQ
jgi:YD repeat-containing protein